MKYDGKSSMTPPMSTPWGTIAISEVAGSRRSADVVAVV
jgi:hypothetical protein